MRRADICSWQAASVSSAFKAMSSYGFSRGLCAAPVTLHRAHPNASLGFLDFSSTTVSSWNPTEQLSTLGQVFSSPVFAQLGFSWDLSTCSGLLIYAISTVYIHQCLEGGPYARSGGRRSRLFALAAL